MSFRTKIEVLLNVWKAFQKWLAELVWLRADVGWHLYDDFVFGFRTRLKRMKLHKILIVPVINQRDARPFNFNCQNVCGVGADSEGQTVGRIWQKVAVVRTYDSIVSVVGSSEHGILSELVRSINLYVWLVESVRARKNYSLRYGWCFLVWSEMNTQDILIDETKRSQARYLKRSEWWWS